MSNLRFHGSRRRLAQAAQRAARRRLQSAQRDGQADVTTAAKLLKSCETPAANRRARQLRRAQGIDLRQFHIAALMSDNGASIALGPLDTHAAVMKAMELTDCGYDRIVLKDAATREELHFTAPPGFGQH